MVSGIQFSHLTHKISAPSDYIVRKPIASYVVAGSTILSHNTALSLFDYKSVIDQGNKVIKHWTSRLPRVYRALKCSFTRPARSLFFCSTKGIFKPDDEFFITASYLKAAMPLCAIAIFSLINCTYIETAFSIDNSCEIRNILSRLSDVEFDTLSHNIPFVYYYPIINEQKIHAERLSEKTLLPRDAIV